MLDLVAVIIEKYLLD